MRFSVVGRTWVAGACCLFLAACQSTAVGQVEPDLGTPAGGALDAGDLDAGGLDAGLPDSGAADAGQTDPGQTDAGQLGAGSADAGQVDAGSADAGQVDAGSFDAGQDDGGSGQADAGSLDAGPLDAGSPDAGPQPQNPHLKGGLGAGPWPTAALTIYNSAQGLLEAPISASTDEAENLWVVSHSALYLLTPGAATFRRYTAADGLHLGPGYTEFPDITLVQGGAANECFVGYYAHDTHDHTANDPIAHLGKMDQVILNADGTLEVRRYDLHNSNNGFYYETRTVMSMVYDHFQQPGNLYVGSNHGVTRIVPSKWRLPKTPGELSNPISVEREWYADHVHPWVCRGGSCADITRPSTFGDWFGLTLADDGKLWMGGLTSAGAIHYREGLTDWVKSWTPFNPFDPAFGDPYPGNPPVFNPPIEGDYVNIRAVASAPDGTVWFASGEVEDWRGPTYGLASYSGHGFLHVDPIALGATEYNILELVTLPDGRLVLGFPNSGLLVWRPGEPKGDRLSTATGLPGNQIGRMSLDVMVNPPALYVPTEGGLAVFRAVP